MKFNLQNRIGANVKVFLVLLLLTASISILIKLSKTFSTTHKVGVKIVNIPPHYVLNKIYPQALTLEVEQSGFSLLFNKSKSLIHEVPFERLHKQGSEFIYDAIQDMDQIHNSLFGQVNNIRVATRKIAVLLDTLSRKRVPVRSQIEINYASGYQGINSTVFTPKSIEVIGPKSQLDTIAFALTAVSSIDNVTASVSQKVKIKPIKGVVYSDNMVVASQEVGKFTEVEFQVPITVPVNVSDTLRIYPKSVQLFCVIPLANFDKVSTADFEISLDFNNFERQSVFVPLTISKKHKSSTNLRLSSRQVRILKIK